MSRSDRELGMDRPITRRDFLNGASVVAASTLVPGRALAEAVVPEVHLPGRHRRAVEARQAVDLCVEGQRR